MGSSGGGGGRESSLEDGPGGAYIGHSTRQIPSTSTGLRPEVSSATSSWGRRSGSGGALGFVDTETDHEFSKRSPRRDRRRTSLGAPRDPSRSSSSRAQNQPPVADFYSTNMPWIAAVIAFAKKYTDLL